MGKKWSTVSISGYKADSPSDDGAATEGNRIKYSTIYTDLTDPIKTGVDSIVSGLDELFTEATTPVASAYTTVATDHATWLEVTGTTTITLLAAATAGAGYKVGIKNAGVATVTVARSGADTIDGDTSKSLSAKDSALYVVNGAGDGYIEANKFSSMAGTFDVNGLSAETSVATDDTLPFYDDNASANKKITFGNFQTAALNINGLSAETAVAAADTFAFYDDGVSNKKITKPNLATALSVANGHRFHVTRGGTDSVAISDGTTTFLPWTTEVVDVGGCFTVAAQTSAQNRFVVPAGAGGTWLFTAMIESAANMTDGTGVVVRLYKNGVGAYAGGSIWQGGISAPSSQVTVIVDTVATDYWQVYWDHTDSASTRAVDGSALTTYWMGARIA